MHFFKHNMTLKRAGLGLAVLVLVGYAWGQDLSQDFLKSFHYRAIGPTRQGGRITDIAVPDWEKLPFTFYVACTGALEDRQLWEFFPTCV